MPPRDEALPLAVFRELLDSTREELLVLDRDGLVVLANAPAAARLNRPQAFVVGKPFAVLISLADRTRWREAVRTVGVEPIRLDVHLLDQSRRIEAMVRCLSSPSGQRFVAVNLSARGAPPAPVAQPPAFDLEGFLLRLPQAVVAVDRAGRIVVANAGARRLLAPARLRVGGRLPEEGAAGIARGLVERLTVVRAALPPRTIELDDGRKLRASGTPAHGDEPAILQLEDVTPEWQEEHRKQEFIRNAAHQLRTPIAAITSALEVLEAGAKDDPATRDRFLAHVRNHADRLTRLTRGLLVLARLEAGADVRLDFVELLPLLEHLASDSDADVHVDCDRSVAVVADSDLLREALGALVENASKYAAESAVNLAVRPDGDSVSIGVFDDGPGVLPEYRTRILEPFFRVSAGGDGFGLGLAIAARSVEAMGGTLRVGDADRGGAFTITLRGARVA